MTPSNPTPEVQVQFLRNIQRLLAEGQFSASYKFALLHALADLAILRGDDTGATLTLTTQEIAEKFVELYWRQCRPFHVGGATSGTILRQNTGKQARIISKIIKSQAQCGGSLFQMKQAYSNRWSKLVAQVDQDVQDMPLWRLQTVGAERLDFLYENQDQASQITLRPGVAYCLRTFYELLRDLVQGAWVRFVQKLNASNLGNVTDLGTFLFGQERTGVDVYQPILMEVQQGVCLYCQKKLSTGGQVDHFIPWSRYPVDLGQNFVLAHDRCNNAKSDYLAAERHLAAWAERNREQQTELQARLQEKSLPSDGEAAVRIARWVYQQTAEANGQVWVMKEVWEHLSPDWSQCFAA
jgi:hypothetical protein